MRLVRAIQYLVVAIILFKALPARAAALNDSINQKRIVTSHPYKLIIADMQIYVENGFKALDEIRILKEKYLPKRVKSKKHQAQVRFMNSDFIVSHSLSGHHVFKFLPISKEGENYEIGVICYKIEKATSDGLQLGKVCAFSYTFRKVSHRYLVIEKSVRFPADLK